MGSRRGMRRRRWCKTGGARLAADGVGASAFTFTVRFRFGDESDVFRCLKVRGLLPVIDFHLQGMSEGRELSVCRSSSLGFLCLKLRHESGGFPELEVVLGLFQGSGLSVLRVAWYVRHASSLASAFAWSMAMARRASRSSIVAGEGGSEEEASTVSVSWKWCLMVSRRRWDHAMTCGSEMR